MSDDVLPIGQRVIVTSDDQQRYSGFGGVIQGRVGPNFRVRLDLEVYYGPDAGTVFEASELKPVVTFR